MTQRIYVEIYDPDVDDWHLEGSIRVNLTRASRKDIAAALEPIGFSMKETDSMMLFEGDFDLLIHRDDQLVVRCATSSVERETIIDGAASLFWNLAWSDHVEEAGCYNLSGCQIEKHSPLIPKLAHDFASKLIEQYEQANGGTPIVELLSRAREADGLADVFDWEYAERFGECLVYEYQGHGVSWEDDHKPFERVEVDGTGGSENCDLMYLAEEGCKHCEAMGRK